LYAQISASIIAGAMLMLSDKPEVYKDDSKLFGLLRSSPVLFSVPGQLYDFDQGKADWLKANKRTDINTGKCPSQIDGDQFGEVCPYWLNEFITNFDNWHVLHRLNWETRTKKSLKEVTIQLSDLGLDPFKEYLVYEFWNDKMIGIVKNEIELGKLDVYGLESLAIREKLKSPQLVSTNRHLSHGAAEIEKLIWMNSTLQGRSRVLVDDEYVMTLYVPKEFKLSLAKVNGEEAKTELNGNILKVSYLPKKTESVDWGFKFEY